MKLSIVEDADTNNLFVYFEEDYQDRFWQEFGYIHKTVQNGLHTVYFYVYR